MQVNPETKYKAQLQLLVLFVSENNENIYFLYQWENRLGQAKFKVLGDTLETGRLSSSRKINEA